MKGNYDNLILINKWALRPFLINTSEKGNIFANKGFELVMSGIETYVFPSLSVSFGSALGKFVRCGGLLPLMHFKWLLC